MKIKFLLTFLCLCCFTNVEAYDFVLDGVYYKINTSYQTATVVASPNKYAGKIHIPNAVTNNNTSYKVYLSDDAFSQCEELDSIIFANSYVSNCKLGSSNVQYVNIKKTVERISENAFYGCTKLKDLVIEDCKDTLNMEDSDAAYIGYTTFKDSESLERLYFGRPLLYNSRNPYWWYSPFQNLKQLHEITIGKHVNDLNKDLFKNCDAIKTVCYNSEEEISYTAFNSPFHGKGIESVIIGENVETLPYHLFYNNQSLKTVGFQARDLERANNSLAGCSNIEGVYIMDVGQWCIADWGTNDHAATTTSCNPLYNAGKLYLDGKLLASVVIPDTIEYIGHSAFRGCKTITEITLPKNITEIRTYAFANTSLKKMTILGNVEKIGTNILFSCNDFEELIILGSLSDYSFLTDLDNKRVTVYAVASEIASVQKKYGGKIVTIGPNITNKQECLRGISFNIENMIQSLDIVITSVNCAGHELFADETGTYRMNNLKSGTPYEIVIEYNIAGEIFTYNFTMTTNSLYAYSSCSKRTQCYLVWNEFSIASDKTLQPTTYGIRFDGKRYPAKDGFVRIENLVPNTEYVYECYAVYESSAFYGGERTVKTKGTSPKIDASAYPTSLNCKGIQTILDATLKDRYFVFENDTIRDSVLTVLGLEPKQKYSVSYIVTTEEGSEEKTVTTFTTSELELTSLTPKPVSETCAIIAASTNISDEETNVGFQWRKYDAPESLKSSEGYAAVYNRQLEGYIKNLQPTSYYNVRAFYKSALGNYYYSDWVTFDPSDFSYFEPTVHTYPIEEITKNRVKVKGYVLAGTDEIVEQGFQYWVLNEGGTTPRNAFADEVAKDVATVLATGQVMSAVLENLKSGTTYCCRAFVQTEAGIVYGEEQTFTTKADEIAYVETVEIDGKGLEIVGYYNLAGSKLKMPQHGVNIVRYRNGITKKIYVK